MGVSERKEREKSERRRAILNTAKELIREKPFEDITMEEIARRLELSRATLYLYFKNKSEIFLTLLTGGMQELETGYNEVLAAGIEDPMQKLLRVAIVFFQFYTANHHYFDLLVTKRNELVREVRKEVLDEFDVAGESVIKPIADAYSSGIKSGAFRTNDPEKMAYLLRAVGIGIAVGFREGRFKFPDDIPLMQDLILHGILAEKK